jgi:hypothetical protein
VDFASFHFPEPCKKINYLKKKKKVWTYPSTQLPPIILLDHLHQSCLQLLSSNKELKLTELNAILLENNLTTYTVTLHQILQTTTEKKNSQKTATGRIILLLLLFPKETAT